MRYIEKNINNEPESLREYRNTTPNAKYKDDTGGIRLALLKEQGYICAYCMKRISMDLNEFHKPKTEIEHYKSQENFPNEDLNYMNMLGVCNGTIRKGNKIIGHCDKSRKYKENGITHSLEFKKLNPSKKRFSEELVTYGLKGNIKPKGNNRDVKYDLNTLLNLNDEKIIQYRSDALDKARNIFEKNNPKKVGKRWSIELFDKEIEKYKSKNSKGMYEPYCQYIIWYFEYLKTKPKYRTQN